MASGRLHDQIAIVTGAGRGIGRAIAERLASEGAHVALFDVNYELAAELAEQLAHAGHRTMARRVDVTESSNVMAAVEQVASEMGSPDILVNNAGIFTAGPLLDVTPQDWNRTLAVNLTGVFYCCQAVARHLMQKRSGRIINMSSIGGKIGFSYNHAYCASKSGVIGLTRVLALELAPHHITVNAVCPGSTDTDMFRAVDQRRANRRARAGYFGTRKRPLHPIGKARRTFHDCRPGRLPGFSRCGSYHRAGDQCGRWGSDVLAVWLPASGPHLLPTPNPYQ